MTASAEALDVAFTEHGEAHARYRFSFGRDATDSYDLTLSELRGGRPGALLTTADVMNLLPTGSSFRRLAGWRSIFGAPFRLGLQSWIAVGVVHVVPHATRGAFPVSNTYLFEDLGSASGSLEAILGTLPTPSENARKLYDVYFSTSETPEVHIADEASVISWALAGWTTGRRRLFRTLLIDESTLRLPGHPGPPRFGGSSRGLRFEHDEWLLCTTPIVRDETGAIVSVWMQANRWR